MKRKLLLMNGTFIFLLIFLFSCKNEIEIKSTFRGNNEHTGVYETIEVAQPKLKWKCNLGGTLISTPALTENVVYVGSGDNNFYTVDANNGEIVWKFPTQGPIHSSAAIYNNLVYFYSWDGNFYALDRKTGEKQWSFATQGEKQYSAANLFGFDTNNEEAADAWDIYQSSPVVENDMVYFGSGDSTIYALDAFSGNLIWTFKTGNVVHSSPAVSNGIVYCGSFDSKLYALNAKTGKEIWSYQTGADEKNHLMCGIQASPAISDGTVYFGSRDAFLYAVDAQSGKLKWKQYFGGSWMPSSAAISEDKLYIGSSDAKKYYRLSKETGKILDSLETKSYTFSSPVISGNTVFIGVFNGFLNAIDKNTSKTRWIFKTDGSEAAIGKYISEDGSLKNELFEGITYQKIDDMKAVVDKIISIGAIMSSPVVANKTLYFTGTDGYLYAIYQEKN